MDGKRLAFENLESLHRALASGAADLKGTDGCLGVRYRAVRSVTRSLTARTSAEWRQRGSPFRMHLDEAMEKLFASHNDEEAM